jgi:hypothetical protein
MASITIRNLDDDVKTRLRVRAASHGPAVHPALPDNDELRAHASPRVPETVGVQVPGTPPTPPSGARSDGTAPSGVARNQR